MTTILIILLVIGFALTIIDMKLLFKEGDEGTFTPYRFPMFVSRLFWYIFVATIAFGLILKVRLLESKLDDSYQKDFTPIREQLYKLK